MSAIINDRDNILQSGGPRLIATTVTISANGSMFTKLKNSGSVTPTSILLTAIPTVFTSPSYSWEYSLATSPSTWVSIGSGDTKSITGSDVYTLLGDASGSVRYRVNASQAGYLSSSSGIFTITLVKETDDSVFVSISRASAFVPANSDGSITTTPSPNSGTVISVYRGAVPLNYGASGPNTFSVSYAVTAGSVTFGSETLSGSTATYGDITAMTTDTATVLFTVTVRNADGSTISPSFTVTETFTKNKQVASYIFQLKPPSVNLIANADGSVSNLTGAATTFEIFNGAVSDAANWTFSKVDTNVTSTLVGNVCTVTSVQAIDPEFSDLVFLLNGDESGLGSTTTFDDSTGLCNVTISSTSTITPSTTLPPVTGGTSIYMAETPSNPRILVTPKVASSWAFGTDDFTISAFVKWEELASLESRYIIRAKLSINGAGASPQHIFGINNGSLTSYFGAEDYSGFYETFERNTWAYLQVCRRGNILEFWVNNCQVYSSSTTATNTFALTEITIGNNSTGEIQTIGLGGYIGGISVVRGKATPKAGFFPTGSADPYWGNTEFLVNAREGWVDRTGKHSLTTYSNGLQNPSLSRGYAGNAALTNSGFYSAMASSANIGSGDFTLEIIANSNQGSPGIFFFSQQFNYIGQTGSDYVYTNLAWANSINRSGTGIPANTGSGLLAQKTGVGSSYNWTVLALCRSGTTLRVFHRGRKVYETTDAAGYDFRHLRVGYNNYYPWYNTEYSSLCVHAIRITKAARYTANYDAGAVLSSGGASTMPTSYRKRQTQSYVDITASKFGQPNVTLRFSINVQVPPAGSITEFSINGTSNWHYPMASSDEWARTKDPNGVWSAPYRIRTAALTSALVPATWNLPATSDGVVTSYTGCSTIMTIYKDGVDDSLNWTYSYASDSGSTTPASGSSGTVTVTAVSSTNDTPWINFTATRTGYPTQTAKFQMFKSKGSAVGGPGITGFSGVYSNAGWVGLKFDANGNVLVKKSSGGSYVNLVTYYQPPSTGIGSGVYIKVVEESGTGTMTGTMNTYLQLNADREWYMTETTPGNYRKVTRIYIATSAAGANAQPYTVPFEIDVP